MKRYTDLDEVYDRVWRELTAAADASDHPFRILTFGTASSDGAPHLRSVVTRLVDPSARALAFHTDRRAQKVEDLRTDARVAWHGWRPDTSEQVRLRGRATVHLDDDVAAKMWENQDPESLVVYARREASGTPVESPDDGLIDAVGSEPIGRDDVAEGRRHFAVVRTAVDLIDWLHLHPDGHYRARFRLGEEGKEREQTWLIP